MKDQGGDPEFGRYLLAVAAFFPRGNLNVVIRAFAEVRAALPDLSLRIVEAGRSDRDLVSELGVGE